MSQITEEIERLVRPLLEQHQIELVDVSYQKEHAGWTLRFYLDKAGGITLDDCEIWNNRLGDELDRANLIDHAYNLEVSSPGIDRPLKKPHDFERFKGQRVSIKLYAPLNGQKNFHGILTGGDESSVSIKLEDRDHREMSLPLSQVAKAKLDPLIEI